MVALRRLNTVKSLAPANGLMFHVDCRLYIVAILRLAEAETASLYYNPGPSHESHSEEKCRQTDFSKLLGSILSHRF
jgi:hypothetical protein